MKAKRKSASYARGPNAYFAARRKRQFWSAAIMLSVVGLIVAVSVVYRNYHESKRPISLYLDRGGSATIAEVQVTRSLPKLKELTNTVVSRMQTSNPKQRQAASNILSAISERQIELSRTDEDRKQGISYKLVALQLRASLENPEEEEPLPKRLERLEEFAREHLSNSDRDVSLNACKALFVAEQLRLSRAAPGDGTVERTGTVIAEVVAKLPNEAGVIALIEGLLDSLPRHGDKNRDLDTLMRAIENAYAANPSEVSKNWLAILRDKQLLIEADLFSVLPGAEKGNDQAIRRVVEIAESLLNQHKSVFGVERGVELALLVEASGATNEALRLVKNFERAAAAFPSDQSSSLNQRIKLAIGRMELLGQPFPLSGKDLKGNELSLAAYSGNVVFVCFVRKETEAQRIGETMSRLALLEKQGVRAVMVVPVGLIAQKANNSFLSVIESPQGEIDLFSACHIDADFCWFLLGKTGKIEKFGVSYEPAIISVEKRAFQEE